MSAKSANTKSAKSKSSRSSRTSLTRNFVAPFRVDDGRKFSLSQADTSTKGGIDKDAGRDIIQTNRERLSALQELLYAQDRWSLLLIFQGMDASGKDSAIKSVFDGVNPQGCDVATFKQPSSEELDHDFLWRSTIRLPARGKIGIFNRSYYEECLVARVHKDVLGKQRLPAELVTDKIWKERFEDIVAFERYLARNGSKVLKFFLNVSKDEQRKRFLDRLDEPAKNWKFSMQDVAERAHWDAYQEAYEDVVRHTSTKHAPWIVVPADHKWFARVVIGSAIVAALEQLDLRVPGLDETTLKEFSLARTALEQEKNATRAQKTSTPPHERPALAANARRAVKAKPAFATNSS